MKFNKAIEKFCEYRTLKVVDKTVVRYERVLKIFCLCLGDPDIEGITLDQVIRYLKEMERLGWSRNGINIVALALRKFFEFYNLQGYKVINESLIPLPRKEYKIPRIATEDQYRKLLDAIPDKKMANNVRNRALISLVWDTGARVGEILSLDVEDIDLENKTAIIRTEKSRGRRPLREIFWYDEANQNLKEWLEMRKDLTKRFDFVDPNAVFMSIMKTSRSLTRGRRLTVNAADGVFRVLSNRAEIPTIVNPHSFRHAFGRSLAEQNAPDSAISNLLGHSNIESSFVYTMLFGKHLRDIHEKFRASKNSRAKMYYGSFPPAKIKMKNGGIYHKA